MPINQRSSLPSNMSPQFWNPGFNPSAASGGGTLLGGDNGVGGSIGRGSGGGYSSGGYGGSYGGGRFSLAHPGPESSNTEINPLQQQGFNNTQSAFGNAQNFNQNIMSLQNEQNVQALQNARDLVSGMSKEAEQGGIARGGVGSGASELLRRGSLDAGLRSTHKLQGELVGEGLRAKNAAMANEISAAGGTASAANMAANTQMGLQLGLLGAQNASQRTLIDQAEAQRRANEAQYNRYSSMLGSALSGAYSGLGSGGGGFGGNTNHGGLGR